MSNHGIRADLDGLNFALDAVLTGLDNLWQSFEPRIEGGHPFQAVTSALHETLDLVDVMDDFLMDKMGSTGQILARSAQVLRDADENGLMA